MSLNASDDTWLKSTGLLSIFPASTSPKFSFVDEKNSKISEDKADHNDIEVAPVRRTSLSCSDKVPSGIFPQEPPVSPQAIVRCCLKSGERDERIVSFYDYFGTVGRGNFGKVALVRQKIKNRTTGQTKENTFAVKICSKEKSSAHLQMARIEAKILTNLPPHPFVVALHRCVEDEKNIHLAMEYCPGGDLFTHLRSLGTLPERVARQIIAELVLAVAHLHEYGIIHRDVKPENVLLDSCGHARLTDFGLSKFNVTAPDHGAYSMCGSPGYIAPEVLSGRGYGFSVDWWQLGMTLLETTTGNLPWNGNSMTDIAKAFNTKRLVIPNYLSGDAADFLTSILNVYPNLRLGCMGVQELKDHAFFERINWKKLYRKGMEPTFNPSSSQYRKRVNSYSNNCGHFAKAAQMHASGQEPRYRVEVSSDENGELKMDTKFIGF